MAFEPESEEDRMQIARQAQRLLDDPLVQRIFAMLQFNIVLAFVRCDVTDTEFMMQLRRLYDTIDQVRDELRRLAQDGMLDDLGPGPRVPTQ